MEQMAYFLTARQTQCIVSKLSIRHCMYRICVKAHSKYIEYVYGIPSVYNIKGISIHESLAHESPHSSYVFPSSVPIY